MSFYTSTGFGTLLGLFLCISDVESIRTLENVAAKQGASVTIPCLYEEQYKANPKYWCKGYYWSSCSIVAYANMKGSTSVIDHQAQNMFTVELNPVSDSGTYWCAAEVGSKWTVDIRKHLYLTVSQDPDLSVNESQMRGSEGGSVTVQCLYSPAYKNTQKQWCRLKNGICYTMARTTTSQDSTVTLTDGTSSFSVQMSGLKKTDAGWYWCSAGDLQVPVYISVGNESPGLPENQKWDKRLPFDNTILALCIILGLLLVFIVVGLVIRKLKIKHRLLDTNKEHGHSLPPSTPEQELNYSTVIIPHHPTISVPPNDEVVYSSVKQ